MIKATFLIKMLVLSYKINKTIKVKRSVDGPPLPEVGGAPSEDSLTLVSNALGIFVIVVSDMIGNLT